MALVNRDRAGRRKDVRLLVMLLAGATGACGDSLVDEQYSGTPLYTLRGDLLDSSASVNETQPQVDVALFWSPHGASDVDLLIEQPLTQRHAEYYRPFEMHLFDEPGDALLSTAPSGARYGIALVGAYLDANHNGHKDASEPFVGSSPASALLRVPQPLSAADSPTGAPLPAGWHLVSLPLACPALGRPRIPEPVADGDCGVPLGIECRSDADCGGGACIVDAGRPWPGGACVIAEPPPNGCRQRGSVLMRLTADPTRAYWVQACETSADCQRPDPFQCDQQIHGCLPSLTVLVHIQDGVVPGSFCGGTGSGH